MLTKKKKEEDAWQVTDDAVKSILRFVCGCDHVFCPRMYHFTPLQPSRGAEPFHPGQLGSVPTEHLTPSRYYSAL